MVRNFMSSGWKWVLSLMLVLIVIPISTNNGFIIQILTVSAVWAIVVIGLDLLVGFTGYVSFGHAAYFGIGGYTSAILVVNCGFSFWLALPIAAILTGIIGYIVSFPSFRLTGTYFAIGTLAFGEIVNIILANWTKVTGGVFGIIGIPMPFNDVKIYYYFVYLCLFVIGFIALRLVSSPVGKALIATKNDEELAESMGINTTRLKRFVFTLSCIIAGFGGSLFVHLVSFASPNSFTVSTSLELIVIVLIGGSGSIFGPIAGVFILQFIGQYLAVFKEFQLMLYGLVLILIVMFLPGGFVSGVRKISAKFKHKKERTNGVTASGKIV